ncbi:hypothetical protein NL676_005361 [Syzygium grande]|nr:hypothetical protein NL676_005361 [Syzygium grande]
MGGRNSRTSSSSSSSGADDQVGEQLSFHGRVAGGQHSGNWGWWSDHMDQGRMARGGSVVAGLIKTAKQRETSRRTVGRKARPEKRSGGGDQQEGGDQATMS